MPPSRTAKYAIFRACERFNLDPYMWDELNVVQQADYLAYSQIREIEEQELATLPIKALAGRM